MFLMPFKKNSWNWPYMQCGDIKEFYKILLVADPQILGEKTESWIARWDSDRYLYKTFSTAVSHVKPDLIMFLGDLMDEGTVATSTEYQRYAERFSYIFSLNSFPSNMTIFLPGDNDIGGEDELVTRSKVSRFKKFFDQPDIVNLGNVQFIKVNKMQHSFPSVNGKEDDEIRIVVSHVPLMAFPSWFSAEAIMNLKPQMIFSAHDHKSVHFAGDLKTGERILIEPLTSNQVSSEWPMTWRFQLSDNIVNEVVVPTCSYRMGATLMGYGAAVIDRKGESLCYSVLLLPSRFMLLYMYIFCLTISVLLIACFHQSRNNYKKLVVKSRRKL
ncbi:metallophosphoesterase isoform X2 [Lycorma delicatula]|uniref:metallophosphoesterase isoform X2 n=1 Tax=Lycorma delicatula TaxID=130591 RepID=UPI003F50FCE0